MATTASLDNTDGTYSSSSGFMGSISYTYSTTYRYSWIADYDGEAPVSDSITLSSDTSSLVLSGTSNGYIYSGSGSVSVTMLGTTHSFTETNTEHYPDPPDYSVVESGSAMHSQTFTLTGDGGTFSTTISGSLNTGGNGVFSGQLVVNPPLTFQAAVAIKDPRPTPDVLHDFSFPVQVEWFAPVSTIAFVRLVISVQVAGSNSYVVKGAATLPNTGSGTTTVHISITTLGIASVQAHLEILNKDTGLWEPLGGTNSDTTSVKVK